MSDFYSEGIDDTIISSLDDATQSIINISDNESKKSNSGPIRNNKNILSKVDKFFTKNFQKCQIYAANWFNFN